MSGTRLLRVAEVCERIGLRKTTIYKMIARGTFVSPVRLGPRTVAWRSDDVDRWIAEREPVVTPRAAARAAQRSADDMPVAC